MARGGDGKNDKGRLEKDQKVHNREEERGNGRLIKEGGGKGVSWDRREGEGEEKCCVVDFIAIGPLCNNYCRSICSNSYSSKKSQNAQIWLDDSTFPNVTSLIVFIANNVNLQSPRQNSVKIIMLHVFNVHSLFLHVTISSQRQVIGNVLGQLLNYTGVYCVFCCRLVSQVQHL